jgi:hypothetical protein
VVLIRWIVVAINVCEAAKVEVKRGALLILWLVLVLRLVLSLVLGDLEMRQLRVMQVLLLLLLLGLVPRAEHRWWEMALLLLKTLLLMEHAGGPVRRCVGVLSIDLLLLWLLLRMNTGELLLLLVAGVIILQVKVETAELVVLAVAMVAAVAVRGMRGAMVQILVLFVQVGAMLRPESARETVSTSEGVPMRVVAMVQSMSVCQLCEDSGFLLLLLRFAPLLTEFFEFCMTGTEQGMRQLGLTLMSAGKWDGVKGERPGRGN